MPTFIALRDILDSLQQARISLADLGGGTTPGDAELLITGEYAGNVDKITLADFGHVSDGVNIVIDLSTFSSDFNLQMFDGRAIDKVTLQGADEFTLEADGSSKISFIDALGVERFLKIAGGDSIVQIERGGGLEVIRGASRDVLAGDQGDDTISSGAGDDNISGGDGDDSITAGIDQDRIGGSGLRSKDFPLIKLTNHSDIDISENNGRSEKAAELLGTYGDADAPLSSKIVFAEANDRDGDGVLDDNDRGGTAETFTIQGAELALDSVQTYHATVTFADGASGKFTAVVVQLENGDVYLAPEPFENSDSALLESGQIESISLDALQTTDTNLYALRLDSAYQVSDADIVDAGGGDDTVDGGIGDDKVLGGAGSDKIIGGAGADQLFGGSGDDVLEGGSGEDYLKVGSGNDAAFGGDGDDTLQNASGDDVLFGGAGNDNLNANIGNDSLFGGAGRDTLTSGSGDDLLDGGSGDDLLYAGLDNDALYGGDGYDQLFGGAGADSVFGGASFDDLYGGSGDDTLFSGVDGDTYLFGGIGNDSLVLSNFSDSAVGGSGADTIIGGDAGDTIFGGTGADSLVGGGGDDTLTAGSGDDTIDLGDIQAGDDVSIYGGSGNDALDLSSASDVTFNLNFFDIEELHGSAFGDTFNWTAQTISFFGGVGDDIINAGINGDTLYGGGGADSLSGNGGADLIEGGAGIDTILGGADSDTLRGGAQADSVEGGAAADSLEGGSGDDTLLGDGDLSTPGTTITINASNFSDTGSGYTVTARNVIPDGGGGSTLSTSSVANVSTFSGGIGASGNISDSDSAVQEQVGFDKASGLSEELSIAFDQDIEELSFQFEVLFTDDFAEVANYALYNDGVLVHQADFTEQGVGSGSGQIDVSGHGPFDEIIFRGKLQSDGTDGSDFIISSVEFTTAGGLAAGGGDTIDGGLGADSILGEFGADSLRGGAGADSVYGGSGDDSLSGGSGDDELFGGAGADDLNAFLGDDTLFGGAGGDVLKASGPTSSANVLYGGSGDDDIITYGGAATVYGGDGNETVRGDSGAEYIEGGAGADEIYAGSFGDDTVFGGSGDDTIQSWDGANVLSGDGGADQITGGDDSDTIYGGAGFDQLSGGAGADTLIGGSGDDTLFGGSGDDSLRTGSGNDALFGGAGADTLRNSSGDDSLVGGSGDDLIVASIGRDTLEGQGGADTLIGGSGDDSLFGGSGNDQIFGGSGDDQAFGGSGEDVFFFADNFGNDTIVGGEGGTDFDTLDFSGLTSPVTINFSGPEAGTATSGGDTITFTEIERFVLTDGADLVIGGNIAGAHVIEARGGNDQIKSTDGADTIYAGSGDDSIDGSQGADLIFGGDGEDTLDGGSGDDSLTGGEGFDTFVIGPGDDTISDFGDATGAVLNDGDQTNNDFVDLSAFYDNISEVRGDFADDGILNQSNAEDSKGRSVDYSDNTAMSGGTTFQGVSSGSEFTQDNTNVVCFAAGTLITTPKGAVDVANLKAGDLVETLDRGAQPILWIGRRILPADEAALECRLRPVLIHENALGPGAPTSDLTISAQHRILVRGPVVRRMFGFREVLAPAKGLVGHPGIEAVAPEDDVTLVHILLPQHAIVCANGAGAETFYPGETALAALTDLGRAAVRSCLPVTQGGFARTYPPARHFITVRQARSLTRRLTKNNKALLVESDANTLVQSRIGA